MVTMKWSQLKLIRIQTNKKISDDGSMNTQSQWSGVNWSWSEYGQTKSIRWWIDEWMDDWLTFSQQIILLGHVQLHHLPTCRKAEDLQRAVVRGKCLPWQTQENLRVPVAFPGSTLQGAFLHTCSTFQRECLTWSRRSFYLMYINSYSLHTHIMA